MAIRYLSGINVDSNTLFVDAANDRVGIGTASPVGKLEVNTGSSVAYFTRTAGDDGLLSPVVAIAADSTRGLVAASGDSLSFRVRAVGTSNPLGGTTVMSLLPSGNVGIGTPSPAALLHIESGQNSIIRLTDNDGSVEVNSLAGKIEFENKDTVSGGVNANIGAYNEDIDGAMYITIGTGTGGTVNERMRITSSGNVGIGETSPLVPLHISRNSASGENIALLLDNNNTTAGNEIGMLFRSMVGSTNTDFEIFGKANAANSMDLVFQSDGSVERMRITSGGNVGIGTTNPTEKLQVSGNIVSSGYVYATGTSISGFGALLGTFDGSAPSSNSFIASELMLGAGAKTGWSVDDILGQIRFYGVDSSGIGARDAAKILAICENGDGTTTTTFSSGLSFYVSPYNAAAFEALRIRSGGNVGIGTTIPFTKLEVLQSASGTPLSLRSQSGNSGNVGLRFSIADNTVTTDAYNKAAIYLSGAGTTNALGDMVFAVNNTASSANVSLSDERMRITSSGNVGIGTTAPASTLHVSGTIRVDNIIGETYPSNTFIDFDYDETAYSNSLALGSIGSVFYLADTNNSASPSTSPAHQFFTGTTDIDTATALMTIRTDGNVGIGTTSPAYGLTVQNNNTINSEFRNSAGDALAIKIGTGLITFLSTFEVTATNMDIAFTPTKSNGTQTEALRIQASTNNVGIGTTSPASKLQVSDSTNPIITIERVDATVTDNELIGQINFKSTDSNDSNSNAYINAIREISGVSQVPMAMTFGTGVLGTVGERLRITSTGNVGIGTTSPQAILHVSAPKPTYTDSAVVFRGGTTNNNSHTGITLTSAGDALTGGVGSNYLVDGTSVSQSNSNRSTGYLRFANTTVAGKTSTIDIGGFVKGTTTDVSRLFIDGDGNVGIGTASPEATLHISGTSAAQLYIQRTSGAVGTYRLGIAGANNRFYITDVAQGADRIVINELGNVGIGTTAPGAKLEVVGDTYLRTQVFTDTIRPYSGNQLTLLNGGSNYLYVNGNVGVGTTAPNAKLNVNTDALGVTVSDASGISLTNGTAAASGAQQMSPTLRWSGQGWKTNATAASQNVSFIAFLTPIQGSANPSGTLQFRSSINGGAYGAGMSLSTSGALIVSNSVTATSFVKTGGTATEYLMANGSVSTLTNPVTGTGTTNYVPKFTSASAIGDSQIFDDGTNVGIGTTNPQAPLHVYKSDTYSAIVSRADWNTSVPTKLALGKQYGVLGFISTDLVETTNDTSYIALNYKSGLTTYAEGLRVYNNGNVGIGTTNPAVKLHVSDASAVFQLTDTNKTANDSIWIQALSQTSWGIGTADNASSGTKITIADSGNIGIGTTAPQKPLEVISSASDFVSVGVQTLGVGQWTGIHFGYRESNLLYRKSAIVFERTDLTSGNAQGKIHILNGPQGNANSATLADAKLTIAENGNVGIGTSSPITTLDVVNLDENITGGVKGLRVLSSVNGPASTLTLDHRRRTGSPFATSASTGPGILFRGFDGSDFFDMAAIFSVAEGTVTSTSSPASISFNTTASGTTTTTERMRITSGGETYFAEDIYLRDGSTTSGDVLVRIYDSSDDGIIDVYRNNSVVNRIHGNGDSFFNAGNVGIGTTSPGYKLDISSGGIRLDGKSEFTSNAYFIGSAAQGFRFNNNADTFNNVIFKDSGDVYMRGNVGIGTTSPAQLLHLYKPSGSVFLALQSSTNYGYFYNDGTNIGLASNIGSTGFKLIVNRSAPDNSLVVNSAGNVGIGTTSPSTKFDVDGDIRSYSRTSTYSIYLNSESGSGPAIEFGNADLDAYGTIGHRSSQFQFNSIGRDYNFLSSGSSVMYIGLPSGNVGIGTTAPQQLLHVLGATNGYMMVQGANDAGQAGIYFKKEDTTGTMNRTKGLIVFHTNVGSGFGRGHLGFCLNSADSNTVVSISDEKFRMVDNGDFLADGDVVAYSTTISDERYKTNITPIDSALDKVNQMRGVSFDWTAVRSGREFGVIAQEIEKIAPEVVSEKELLNGETMKTVSYTSLVPFLIESIKELTQQVNELKAQLDGLTK